MREINIAGVLVEKRREKGITQEELASYMGVSKASVSKWETGQSYPDVTFLPQLAAYFNISIDELMDYKPQMEKEDIRKLYRSLSVQFTQKPFAEALDACRAIIHKYYSCFPLLLQMGILLFNHMELAKESAQGQALLLEIKPLFERVRSQSGETALIRQARYMEALCCIALNDPSGALALLEREMEPALPPEILLATAYQMTGRADEAREVLQIGMYQNVVELLNFLPAYLPLCVDKPEKFEETLRRGMGVAEAFDMRRLHPAVLVGLYLAGAQGYCAQGNAGRALDLLEGYAQMVTGNIYPLRLHGDGYFDLLERWLAQLDLGTGLPRDEKTIRRSMHDAVALNPAYAVLQGEARFSRVVDRLKENIK